MSKKYNRSSGFGNYGYLWWKSEERYLFFFGINRRSVCNCCCPRPVCFYFIYMYLNICMILILVWSVWLVINCLCITIRKVILYISKLVHFQAKYLSWYPRVKTKSWDWSPVDGGLHKCRKNECKENYSVLQVYVLYIFIYTCL